MTVLEVSGISEDFSADAPFEFAFIGGNWRLAGGARTTLKEDPIHISLVRVPAGMKEIEIHIRNQGQDTVQVKSAQVVCSAIESMEWTTQQLVKRGRAELLITRLEETAYYTRDLKYAAEPKLIWVWTQGIAN